MAESSKTQVRHTRTGVLLVCQSDNTLSALAAILSHAGATTLTAQSAEDGWECIRSGTVGCVVQDLTAPNADVFAMFRAARTSRNTCSIPFLFLIRSDFKIPVFAGIWPEISHDSWLVLPCPAQQFLTSVRQLLASTIPASQIPEKVSLKSQTDSALIHELFSSRHGLFAGQLGMLDVTQILSLIEPLKLTGCLKLSDGERTGNVHFVEGAVKHAELNEIEGHDALFLLFHVKHGTFRFEIQDPTQKRTIEGNMMTLLLEGLRQMDEAKAMVSSYKEKRANPSSTAPLAASSVRGSEN